jgi:hypothetical protein
VSTVIAGYRGQLLPEDFLDRWLAAPGRVADASAVHRAVRAWRTETAALGPASGLRAMVDVGALPLAALLGLQRAGPIQLHDDFASVVCRAGPDTTVLLVTAWGAPMQRYWRHGVLAARHADANWCVMFNGTHLRLVRPSRLQSRRYAELDLDTAADDGRSAAALWSIFGGTALGGDDEATSVRTLLALAERHAASVCRSLRGGVLEASTHLLRTLLTNTRAQATHDALEQSLIIVYRLLFLLFAEARGLVPVWHPVYRESYSIEALRHASLDPGTVGVWDALRAITRLAHAGCQAGGLRVTAFNGRLFSPARTQLAERTGLDDDAAKQAIVAVSTRAAADGEGRERIDYRDLGVEQLGAVYETLLDYAPHVERGGRGVPLRVSLRAGSGVRKATGTFYTPEPLVAYLVRDALSPLVREATPERLLQLTVLDPSMGSGAFLVSACRFLATAYESALIDNGRCHATDIGPSDRAAIRRLVAERCLYGVDLNPTAVQLARLSLWLTTLAADRPLTFLDHHLREGDSLAGTWLWRLRTSPSRVTPTADLPLFPDASVSAAIRGVLPTRFSLALDPNDSAAQVHAKERALAALAKPGSPLATWTRVADLWCSAWLASPPVPARTFSALSDAIVSGRSLLPETLSSALLDRVDATRQTRRLFHWELEFPEVFFDANGNRRPDAGFDAILGNPPWDMVRADGTGDRTQARVDAASLVRFARDSGVYETRSDGHVNRYQLFVERSVALCKPGGRIGLVLPSGMVADASSAGLRRLLFSRCAVDRIVGFDNRTGTFPIHRSVKFVLLSAAAGERTREIACRFGEVDPTALDQATTDDGRPDPKWFTTRVTPELLERVSGNDLSIPDLRSPVDLTILERASALFAPLASPSGWGAQFGRELNATEDRHWFRVEDDPRSPPHQGWVTALPVLEGKHIEPFRVDPRNARWRILPEDSDRLLGHRHHRTRLAYRDVASATNRVTLIAALLPPRTASTHTLFCLKTRLPLRAQWLLCALFNSLVVNYLVRMRVATHVTTAIVERLPIPREEQLGASMDDLVSAAERLSCGPDPLTFARLNATVAQIYQLRDSEFAHVLDTFPLIARDERDAMLATFRQLKM